jgi:phenylpyruvate tautomerase PptA (4-oxalocrotonate tautomerase family)
MDPIGYRKRNFVEDISRSLHVHYGHKSSEIYIITYYTRMKRTKTKSEAR